MLINFSQIRPHRGSQQHAFEELCCQLAAFEHAPNGRFVRKGAPDAGVECYWIFRNGDEWGWQAKYFLDTPGDSQWSQMDQSVATALERHPHLTRYTICLPINRPDARVVNQKSMMVRWNKHVAKWEQDAAARKMSVTFDYWGESEITERLSRREHEGRALYWFSVDLFGQDWLQRHLDAALAAAGPRYTPEVNVELPIAADFEALGGDPVDLGEHAKGILRRTQEAVCRLQDQLDKLPSDLDINNSLSTSIPFFVNKLNQLAEDIPPEIPWDDLSVLATLLIENILLYTSAIDSKRREVLTDPERDHLNSHITRLRDVAKALDDFVKYAATSRAALFNTRALLVTGAAGTGKTHLLCYIANSRVKAGFPVVVLTGPWSTDAENPWVQIIKHIGLDCTRDQLLGALQAAGEAHACRALILIDALNEGAGASYWQDRLPEMLTYIRHYPNIGIALTVRSTYRDVAIRDDLVPQRLVELQHEGFAGREYDAMKTFFSHYHIELPRTPLLEPEFSNPLFLKLTCETLQRQSRTTFEPGMLGITSLFNAYVDTINQRAITLLSFYPREKPVYTAISALAKAMAEAGTSSLPRKTAQATINTLVSDLNHTGSLFEMLTNEGLLLEDRRWDHDTSDWIDVVSFAYERFADHQVVNYLLDQRHCLPDGDLTPGGFHLAFPEAVGPCVIPQRWIEALCIQIPERTGLELYDAFPLCAECPSLDAIDEAFIQSLIWRRRDAFTESTNTYIKERALATHLNFGLFMEAMFTVSCDSSHPYNARRLHDWLMRHSLPDRDTLWTIFINDRYAEYRRYGTHTGIARLIDWAWHSELAKDADASARELCALALAWFLTASNRYLRDAATKAMVGLLQHSLPTVETVLNAFSSVDDPYISERLMAVAYGCAMRNHEPQAVCHLAQIVYDRVFADGNPPPDIVLRDYARGIIELAAHLSPDFLVDTALITPPYNSEWPTDFPTSEEVANWCKPGSTSSVEEKGLSAIRFSLSDAGDFARYIIGTNGSSNWSSTPRTQQRPLRNSDILSSFNNSLDATQAEAWHEYMDHHRGIEELRNLLRLLEYYHRAPNHIPGHLSIDQDELATAVAENKAALEERKKLFLDAEAALRAALTHEQMTVVEQDLVDLVNRTHDDYQRFDLSLAQRWIFGKVLDLGWTKKSFGEYDWLVKRFDNTGRSAQKAERIGKKYQWIAFHEFMARLSDNFYYIGHSTGETEDPYCGDWQYCSYLRDIDPSSLLQRSKRPEHSDDMISWWSPLNYDKWTAQADDTIWLNDVSDLPDLQSFIQVTEPQENTQWLNLNAIWVWRDHASFTAHDDGTSRREVFYILNSYIVHSSNAKCFEKWSLNKDFYGQRLPEPRDYFHIFLGEYFWSPCYLYYDRPYNSHSDWSKHGCDLPIDVLLTASRYIWESPLYDCSIEDTINATIPSRQLAKGLGLRTPSVEGHFLDQAGKLTAFDPSLKQAGPGALLVRQDALVKFLEDNDYCIFWTLLGEKNAYRDDRSEEWPGCLCISGVYTIRDGKVEGQMTPCFHSRDTDY